MTRKRSGDRQGADDTRKGDAAREAGGTRQREPDPRKRDGDLSVLSLNDLMALRDRVEAEISDRRLEYERTLRARGGMTERDGPRYRNPANSAETWSGQGRRPSWIEKALADGLKLSDLEIVDDRPVRSEDS